MDHPGDAPPLMVGGRHVIGVNVDPAPQLIRPEIAEGEVNGVRAVDCRPELLARERVEALDELLHPP